MYGAALMARHRAAARGTYVVMGDADDTYRLQGPIYPSSHQLRAGADFVIGCRFPPAAGNFILPRGHAVEPPLDRGPR